MLCMHTLICLIGLLFLPAFSFLRVLFVVKDKGVFARVNSSSRVMNSLKDFEKFGLECLNHFFPNVPFWFPWKHQKTTNISYPQIRTCTCAYQGVRNDSGFLMFTNGSKRNIGKKRVKTKVCNLVFFLKK